MKRSTLRMALHCLLTAMLTCTAAACVITPMLPAATEFKPDRQDPLQLRYFGASTLTISDGSTTIMVDGFFSRPPLGTLTLALAGSRTIKPDIARIEAARAHLGGQNIDAIFVAHAHHDHAMDTAHVARRYRDVRIYGSTSALKVVRGQRLRNVTDGRPVEASFVPVCVDSQHAVGDFTVTVLEAGHEGTFVAPGGELAADLRTPARLRDYRAGPSFAFHIAHPKGRILVMPSADPEAKPDAFRNHPADVVLLGIGLLGREDPHVIESYWNAVVHGTGAKTVYPIHWDNFMHELGRGPMRSFWWDRMRMSRRVLCTLAQPDDSHMRTPVSISLLPLYEPIPVPATHAATPTSRFCP